jgi:hypothetical protein
VQGKRPVFATAIDFLTGISLGSAYLGMFGIELVWNLGVKVRKKVGGVVFRYSTKIIQTIPKIILDNCKQIGIGRFRSH